MNQATTSPVHVLSGTATIAQFILSLLVMLMSMGWIVGFGDLKPLKDFLEYYFDHTALASADDPRLEKIYEHMLTD
jgi:hypothetical protein